MQTKIYPKKLIVGLVGTCFISDLHMEALKEIKSLDIVGCCDVNKLRAENFQKRWGLKNAYDNIETLVTNESPDVLHILVPPDFHFQVANNVIELGINVFLEKPM